MTRPDDLSGYLDYNATTPLRRQARAAVAEALELAGNPSSVHGPGRAAWRRLSQAREQVAGLVGVGADQVIFTSGATEANNLAIAGSGRGRILVSAIEHDCVLAAAGPAAERIPVTADGIVDLAALEAALTAYDARNALVCVMLANNETGAIQPIAEVVELCRRRGAALLVDCAQAAGRIPLPPQVLSADYVTLSAHKFGGPKGVGALIKAPDAALDPLLVGGAHEGRLRAGTENLPGIVGMGAAAEAAATELTAFAALAALRDRLEAGLRAVCPDAPVYGAAAPRLPNTTSVGMPGVPAETQVMHFDLAGYAVSAGAACSSGKVTRSHVLDAMGAGPAAETAVRVSLGWTTTAEAIDGFVAQWAKLYTRRQRRAA